MYVIKPRARTLFAAALLRFFGCSVVYAGEPAPMPTTRFVLNETSIEDLNAGNRDGICRPENTLPALLRQIGAQAYIYPSENYYYFTFYRAGMMLSGSLRLASDRRDKGIADYVCYETNRPWASGTNTVRVQEHLGADDKFRLQKLRNDTYLVSYGGYQTRFFLHQLDHQTPGSQLMSDEIRVGRLLDESGAAFELIFNRKLKDFYFLLDIPLSATDDLIELTPNTHISRLTGFVYYRQPAVARYVLVAVNRHESQMNSALDGPGDQLPENDYDTINFWEYVHQAYPDIEGRHSPGGTMTSPTDVAGMIFAISSYRLYDNPENLSFIDTCRKSLHAETDRIACMIWGHKGK